MVKKIVIAIGSDHRGFALKTYLMASSYPEYLISWIDVGTHSQERTDYPLYAAPVCALIQKREAHSGVLLCGTGVGMVIAANRFCGIYAGVAWNMEIAQRNKEDDNCNILALPADYISEPLAVDIFYAWLTSTFKDDRYKERLDLIDQLSR